jgi:hypothetical protein
MSKIELQYNFKQQNLKIKMKPEISISLKSVKMKRLFKILELCGVGSFRRKQFSRQTFDRQEIHC